MSPAHQSTRACPVCQQPISIQAHACFHCGAALPDRFTFVEDLTEERQEARQPETRLSFAQWLLRLLRPLKTLHDLYKNL